MKPFFNDKASIRVFEIFAGLCLAMLAVYLLGGRQFHLDFQVYYTAARRLLQGEALYEQSDVFYRFKYAPTAAFFFTPFTLFPLSVAKPVYWVVLSGVAGLSAAYVFGIGQRLAPKQRLLFWPILSLLFAIGAHLARELHLGQVNLLLLGIYLFVYFLLTQEKPGTAGFLVALSLFVKPFGLLFLGVFFVQKRWPALRGAALGLALGAVLPLAFYSSEETVEQYAGWMQELTIELSAKQDVLSPGNHTLVSIVLRNIVAVLGVPQARHSLILAEVGLLAGVAALFCWLLRSPHRTGKESARLWFMVIALIPLMAFTSYNAFIFTFPLLAFSLLGWSSSSRIVKMLTILAVICIGINMHDLWGPHVFKRLEDASLVGWGGCFILFGQLLDAWRNQKSLQSVCQHSSSEFGQGRSDMDPAKS